MEWLEDRRLLTAEGSGVPEGALSDFFCDPNSEPAGAGAEFCQAPVVAEDCEATEFPDVNADGQVTPVDALLLINHINSVGSGQPAPRDTPPVLDLNCDKLVTPADVMIVINHLNRLATADNPNPLGLDIDALIQGLQSAEGEARTAATKELLDLGEAAAPVLAFHGAVSLSPTGNIRNDRIDAIYTLIAGLASNDEEATVGYATRSFGLQLEAGTQPADVDQMGDRYGFTRTSDFAEDQIPNCYVTLHPGQDLENVMEQLLRNEPSVVSVNLNYFVA